ncbi:outer membrane protein [Phreatobacter sp. HK31-P]
MSLRAHFLSSACVVAISAGAAQAQGLPAPAGGWAGGYVGGLIGAGFSMNRFSDVGGAMGAAGTTYSINPVGVALGLYAGYNWQLSSTGVVGVEADLTYNTASGSTPGIGGGSSVSAKAQFAGSLRVRAGVAIDRALLYVTAGLALGNPSQYAVWGAPQGQINSLRVGLAVGAGVEYMVSRNWTVRFETIYYDFGSSRATDLTNTGYVFPTRSSQVQARVGASYRF